MTGFSFLSLLGNRLLISLPGSRIRSRPSRLYITHLLIAPPYRNCLLRRGGAVLSPFLPAIVFYLLKRHDAFFKDAPAFFIIFKHIPACAGRT